MSNTFRWAQCQPTGLLPGTRSQMSSSAHTLHLPGKGVSSGGRPGRVREDTVQQSCGPFCAQALEFSLLSQTGLNVSRGGGSYSQQRQCVLSTAHHRAYPSPGEPCVRTAFLTALEQPAPLQGSREDKALSSSKGHGLPVLRWECEVKGRHPTPMESRG